MGGGASAGSDEALPPPPPPPPPPPVTTTLRSFLTQLVEGHPDMRGDQLYREALKVSKASKLESTCTPVLMSGRPPLT